MTNIPPQKQEHQPGKETEMVPAPHSFMDAYRPADKLKDKVAIISGGDSGIGRAVCIAYAKEGADIALIYLDEDHDAEITKRHIEAEGRRAITLKGDIADPRFLQTLCRQNHQTAWRSGYCRQ